MFSSLHLTSLDWRVSLPTSSVGLDKFSGVRSSPTKVDTGLDSVIAGLLWRKCQTLNLTHVIQELY